MLNPTLERWASDLVKDPGVPFKERGRDRHGSDCYGPVFMAFREVLGIPLPRYDDCYEHVGEEQHPRIAAKIASELHGWPEIRLGAELPGDVILLRVEGRPIHMGLIIRPGDMLHAAEGMGVCIERYSTPRWRDRVLAFYRHPDLAAAESACV